MVTCAVENCKNRSATTSKKNGISFHRFPRDPERRKQWVLCINRNDSWQVTHSSTICSEHFAPCDFYMTESGLRKLSLNAVPSINLNPYEPREPTIGAIGLVEVCFDDSQELIDLKHKVRRLEVIAANRLSRLKLMWSKNKRLKKKLALMKTTVDFLVKHGKEGDS